MQMSNISGEYAILEVVQKCCMANPSCFLSSEIEIASEAMICFLYKLPHIPIKFL